MENQVARWDTTVHDNLKSRFWTGLVASEWSLAMLILFTTPLWKIIAREVVDAVQNVERGLFTLV